MTDFGPLDCVIYTTYKQRIVADYTSLSTAQFFNRDEISLNSIDPLGVVIYDSEDRTLVPYWLLGSSIQNNFSVDQAPGVPDTGGIIDGIVKVDGNILVNGVVRLYYKVTGTLILSVLTDANGYFKFEGLDRNSNAYFVVAHYSIENAIVYDMLTPTSVT